MPSMGEMDFDRARRSAFLAGRLAVEICPPRKRDGQHCLRCQWGKACLKAEAARDEIMETIARTYYPHLPVIEAIRDCQKWIDEQIARERERQSRMIVHHTEDTR